MASLSYQAAEIKKETMESFLSDNVPPMGIYETL